MKKYLFIYTILMISSCKNPYSNENISEDKKINFEIEDSNSKNIRLRLNPSIGEKTNLSLQVELIPDGMLIPLETNLKSEIRIRAIKNDEIEKLYTLDFQRITFDSKIMGTKISYDSQKDNHDIPKSLEQEFRNILSNKFEISLDSLANLKTIKHKSIKNNLASKSINLNMLFIPFPSKPVSVGDSWTAIQKIQNHYEKDLIYTVDKISDKEVAISVNSKDKNVNGKYLIDREKGYTKQANMKIIITDNDKNLQINININSI